MAVETVTVTGHFEDAQGVAARGYVTFTLSSDLLDSTGNVVVTRNRIVETLDASGEFSIVLAATNSPGINPSGVTYDVTIFTETANQRSFTEKTVELDYQVDPVDVADLLPVDDAEIVYGTPSAANVSVDDDDFDNIAGTNAQAVFDSIDDLIGGGGSPMVFNVVDYGAVGDNSTDDGPAVQDAVDDAVAAGGGIIFFPAGTYKIATQVTSAENAVMLRLVGVGGASKIRPAVGSGQRCFRLRNCSQVSLVGLRFIGTTGAAYDAYVVVDVSGSTQASIEWCSFHGLLPQPTGGAAVVLADAVMLAMRQVWFGACGGTTATPVPVVRALNSRGLDFNMVRFTDFATESGFGAPRGSPWAWIRVESTTAPLIDAWSQPRITMSTIQMDEGARRGLVIEGGANKYEHVHLIGIRGNIASHADAVGVSVDNVRHLVLEDSFYAYQSAPERSGFVLSNIDTAYLKAVYAREGAGEIEIASTVAYAELIDCDATVLTNNATASNVYDGEPPYGDVAADVQEEGVTVVVGAGTVNFVGAGATVTDVGGVATVGVPALTPTVKAGLYFGSPNRSISATAAVNQRRYAIPLVIDRPLTVDRIRVNVTATTAPAGAVARLGVYSSTDGFPNAVLHDFGTVAIDTTGAKEITIAQTLPAGLLWLACQTEFASGSVTVSMHADSPSLGGLSIFNSAFSSAPGWFESGKSGALDAWSSVITNIAGAAPVVLLRAV